MADREHHRLTVGSLFSGIGGFDLGFQRAGMSVLWQSEIDPFASAVLRRHWPDVPNHGDITCLWNPEPVDILCGGFPCQDISVAGTGAGLDGERSGLWREFFRLVQLLRPRWVVVENVAALRTRGYDRIHDDLEGAGYSVWPTVVGADDVGAPHRRKRAWIVAHTDRDAWKGWSPGHNRAHTNDRLDYTIERQAAESGTRGHLSPRFVSWMMGYPLDWCDIGDQPLQRSATRSSRKSRK